MGDIIRVRNSLIDTSGRSQREYDVSVGYDSRIPQRAKDWARYGSDQAADLVNADARLTAARRSARDWIQTVRKWAVAEGYSPEARAQRVAETKADLFGYYFPAYRQAVAHAVACEAAYQAFLAGQKAAQP
jgi:hypothetical protein